MRTNKKLQRETFSNLGSNDPKLLKTTFAPCSFGFDTLMHRKLIFHDQEPVMFSSYEQDWMNKIYSFNRLETGHIFANSEINSVEKNKILAASGWHDFYWFSNGFLALEWYRFFKYATYLEQRWEPKYTFSSYNRILPGRQHRAVIADHLHKNYTKRIILSKHTGTQDDIFINTVSTQSDNYSYDIHENDFIDSFCHVITERLFYESRIHLTEKTFRPIICCRPFILVSSPGALSYLQSYGFKTFSNFWPEDYDNIKDHNERLNAIIDVVDYIGSLRHDQMLSMLNGMKDILLYNRRHFYTNFQDIITVELYKNLETALHAKTSVDSCYQQILDSLTPAEIELLKASKVTNYQDAVGPQVIQYSMKHLVGKRPNENTIRPFVAENIQYYIKFYQGIVHKKLDQWE